MRGCPSEIRVDRPNNLNEALEILKLHPDARPLAGGTDLMVVFEAGKLKDKHFVDLSRLDVLKGFEFLDEGVWIGAGQTYRDLRRSAEIQKSWPMLIEAAKTTGAIAIQNRGTLGGNIVNASPAADTPPALLAYGAKLELVSREGTRIIPYDSFHADYKVFDLKPGELIQRIFVRRPGASAYQRYWKVGTRAAQAISKVCLSFCIELEGERVSHAGIGVGAVAPIPLLARKTAGILIDSSLDDKTIDRALEVFADEISPIDDIRSNATYRKRVASNILKDTLFQFQRG